MDFLWKNNASISSLDMVFYRDVTKKIVYEKALKRQMGEGSLSSKNLREGQTNMDLYLDDFAYLLETRDWLCGAHITAADLTLAAHLSCLDYFSAIPWQKYPTLKAWYARLKSRPSFKPLLRDSVPGLPPAMHYTNLDF